MSAPAEKHTAFLGRFISRGWLHGAREDQDEQDAVNIGLRKRWLRREMSEVHFTPKGRAAIAKALEVEG